MVGSVSRLAAALQTKMGALAAEQSGAIAVELAYVSPFVLAILLGVTDISRAISQKMTLQAATRAGTNFGLIKPPVQGDVQNISNATRAVLPMDWTDPSSPDSAQIGVTLVCQCELTGPIACGTECGAGERSQTYLKVDASKNYVSLVKFPNWSPSIVLSDSSIVRLQ